MEIIKDGTGRGFTTKVDSKNRLWTYSINRTELAFQSEFFGKTFMVYAKRNFTDGAGNDESIIDFKYIGNHSLHVSKIIFSTNSDIAKAELFVNSTNPSGGYDRTPINMNLGSRVSSEVTVLTGESDLTADVLDVNEILDVRFNGESTIQIDFGGALVLNKDNTFHIKGEVENAGEKMRIAVYYYEEND